MQLLAHQNVESKVRMNPQPENEDSPWPTDASHTLVSDLLENAQGGWCPSSEPGQRFWIRESFAYVDETRSKVVYRADFPRNTPPPFGIWQRPFYLPRQFSRLGAEVVSVNVKSEPDESDNLAQVWNFVRVLKPLTVQQLEE